jgi:hypothetical protein
MWEKKDCLLLESNVASAVWSTLSLICSLFSERGPAAISRLISKVVIQPVYGVLWRRGKTHVSEKILKRKPALAHLDAPLPIAVIIFVVRIIAALLHPRPRVVGLGMPLSMGSVIRNASIGRPLFFAKQISAQTTARVRDAAAQTVRSYCFRRAAIALAGPVRLAVFHASIRNGYQKPESLSGKVKSFHLIKLTTFHTERQ